jgi:phosphoglycolate phosphatase
MKLILWDIDGTILCGGNAGEKAFESAMKRCFQVDASIHKLDYAGRTDAHIARMFLEHFSLPVTPENLHQVLEAYLEELAVEFPVAPAKTHPGVLEIIEKMKHRSDLVQGLLTGNLERGAKIKLGRFNAWHYFEFGAFADDSAIRNELGPFALRRASERHQRDFAPENVYIIGDTPHDIACAKVIGAKSIVVATGRFTLADLLKHEPSYALPDLSDHDALFACLN